MSDPTIIASDREFFIKYEDFDGAFAESIRRGEQDRTAGIVMIAQYREALSTPTTPDEGENRSATAAADPKPFATGESGSPLYTTADAESEAADRVTQAREEARARLLEAAERETRGRTHDGSDAGTAHWWVRVRYDDLMALLVSRGRA